MEEKLRALVLSAKYDRAERFIYHAKGRRCVIPQFKMLFTNYCEKNCYYCANRRDRNVRRFSFTPSTLVNTFLGLYKRGMVKGLFLSSGIHHNAQRTMEKMIATVDMLRKKGYSDFVHLKILPGADDSLVEKAVELADRVSVNLESPSSEYLQRIAGEKKFDALLRKLYLIHRLRMSKGKKLGIATQFVVGGAGESDRDILLLVYRLIRELKIQKVYFSAFYPVRDTPMEGCPPVSKRRERRLYRAFFLMKEYNLSPAYLPFEKDGNIGVDDPKEGVLEKMDVCLPLEVNTAPPELLLLVPGIGPVTAKQIISVRRTYRITSPSTLLRMGVKNKSLDFLLIDGRYYGRKFGFPLFKVRS